MKKRQHTHIAFDFQNQTKYKITKLVNIAGFALCDKLDLSFISRFGLVCSGAGDIIVRLNLLAPGEGVMIKWGGGGNHNIQYKYIIKI